MNIGLDGKRALLTGGSSGIGATIAFALADAGSKLAINFSDQADYVTVRTFSVDGGMTDYPDFAHSG